MTVKSGDYGMAFNQNIGTMERESNQVCLKMLESPGITRGMLKFRIDQGIMFRMTIGYG